jgi:hypothetical protein
LWSHFTVERAIVWSAGACFARCAYTAMTGGTIPAGCSVDPAGYGAAAASARSSDVVMKNFE